jgi:predicted PurR-regulated permease PerM
MTILTGINFLVGVGNTVFLWFLGVEFAPLWGMLAWFMGYIPSIGFIIALIPPVILAYAQFGLTTAVVVLIGYILINGGVQNFIQPKIMGQGLKINPVVVFVGLFIWGYLLGGIGALLAVPLTLLVLTIMENFEGTRPLAILMRYTGEDKKEEREKAAENVKGLWGKVKGAFSSDRESQDMDE